VTLAVLIQLESAPQLLLAQFVSTTWDPIVKPGLETGDCDPTASEIPGLLGPGVKACALT
jgi:hypothetical protein